MSSSGSPREARRFCASFATVRSSSCPSPRNRPIAVEREIKLRFEHAEAARTAVLALGARPLRARRLQHDALFDTATGTLRAQGCALRVRADGSTTFLTFKGIPQPGVMKTREEHETRVEDRDALERVLSGLGYEVWFRYEKYREEFSSPGVIIAIDETPVGTFVEIEGDEQAISRAAAGMGRAPADFIVKSYRGLFAELGPSAGITGPHMLFTER